MASWSPRQNEGRYFLEREAIQRAKVRAEMEAKAKAAAEHRDIAEHVGVDDEQIGQRIRELGFGRKTARVLHLMPLVEVAWADGKLSSKERRVIVQAADAHGIEPGSEAGILLASLLEKRPSRELLDRILEVLHDLLRAKDMHPHDLLEACVDVAGASGGFLGLSDRVSNEEQTCIEKIAETFGEEAKQKIAEKLA